MRAAAGIDQAEVARRMGKRGKTPKTMISRLERGWLKRPTVGFVTDYVKACGASISAVADLLGMPAEPAAGPQPAPKPKRPKQEPTLEERLRRYEAALRKKVRDEMFESQLHEFLKASGISDDLAEQSVLAKHARGVLAVLQRQREALARLRHKQGGRAEVPLEKLESVERVAHSIFQVMVEGGDYDRALEYDKDAAVKAGLRVVPAKRAEERLMDEARTAFDVWTRARQGVRAAIFYEVSDRLVAQGMAARAASDWAVRTGTLCSIAEECERDPTEKQRRAEESIASDKDQDKAREVVEYVFRRWDEMKHTIPVLPAALQPRKKQ